MSGKNSVRFGLETQRIALLVAFFVLVGLVVLAFSMVNLQQQRQQNNSVEAAGAGGRVYAMYDENPYGRGRGSGHSRDVTPPAHVPGGPGTCTNCNGTTNGVTPQDCVLYLTTTVQDNGSTCTSNCRGGFQIDIVMSTSGPFDGGLPCTNEPGDIITRSCTGDESSQACYCSANDFYITDSITQEVTNPYFDSDTVMPCGNCDGLLNGQQCYLTCKGPVLSNGMGGTTLSGPNAITCMAGTWSLPQPNAHNYGLPPSCAYGAQTCPVIPEDDSLSYAPGGVCDGAQIGDLCVAFCNPGYVLKEGANGMASCTEEGWSNLVACVLVQQYPSGCPALPQDSSFTYEPLSDGSASVCVGAMPGDVCSISCNSQIVSGTVTGYVLAPGNSGSATCMPGGYWSAPMHCVLKTPFN